MVLDVPRFLLLWFRSFGSQSLGLGLARKRLARSAASPHASELRALLLSCEPRSLARVLARVEGYRTDDGYVLERDRSASLGPTAAVYRVHRIHSAGHWLPLLPLRLPVAPARAVPASTTEQRVVAAALERLHEHGADDPIVRALLETRTHAPTKQRES